jgi:hypothetical protein
VREEVLGLGGAVARIEHHDLDRGSRGAERFLERLERYPARLAVGTLKVQTIAGGFADAAVLAENVPAGERVGVMSARDKVAAGTNEVHHRGPELA